MSIFSIYVGFCYNDIFGVSANLFGSAYEPRTPGSKDSLPRKPGSPTYGFGLDPAWHSTVNELSFANSYKMKLSIILGVLQMCLGLFCSLLNALHARSEIDIWCEFVPQSIFMLSVGRLLTPTASNS